MGLFSSYNTNSDHLNTSGVTGRLTINHSEFIVNTTPIGNAPWDGDSLSHLLEKYETLSSLSKEEQRKSYGVTKPWPPRENNE